MGIADYIQNYETIIFDFDGVIADTNIFKHGNILEACVRYVDKQVADTFVEYFTQYNGVPRELKIFKYFADTKIAENILSAYNELNRDGINTIQLTESAVQILETLKSKQYHMHVLSGGNYEEIVQILRQHNLLHVFDSINAGPTTKQQNLSNLDLVGKTIYIGDSELDYRVATEFNFDFVFMTGYTQFSDWSIYFENKPNVLIINNLTEII